VVVWWCGVVHFCTPRQEMVNISYEQGYLTQLDFTNVNLDEYSYLKCMKIKHQNTYNTQLGIPIILRELINVFLHVFSSSNYHNMSYV